MYKVMLIDDEKSARALLLESIDWASLDMEVVGEASSGIEAINTIDELQPDIAFVDIYMPFMNGIEFSKIALERYKNIKIVILTAFDEFEYARLCIGLPICDYILKPIVRSEIYDVLHRIVDSLAMEKEEIEATVAAPIHEIEPSSVRRIATYIDENYGDSGLNLTSVAQEFGFNPSYLSRKFKADMGQSFVEYLTEVRMKRALELASGNEKMFCTAIAVGIPDPNYFGRCFKKYTGISYSEYIKKL
ncbi:MAG TPA: response regulator [Bacillota bacterium]|nr:response regulator [Bacillota bacterium]